MRVTSVAWQVVAQRFYVETLGCPKNQVDSELMLGMLARSGHEITDVAETGGVVDAQRHLGAPERRM